MKYLLIDTWNGSGYSDSTATIVETTFPNSLAKQRAIDGKGDAEVYFHEEVKEIHPNGFAWAYQIGEDAGLVTILPIPKNLVGVVVNPIINDFTLVEDQETWQAYINAVKEESEDYEEDQELFETIHHSMGDGDWILFPLTKQD